jgi:glycosyltransferase involved in cell wall biosynthesis
MAQLDHVPLEVVSHGGDVRLLVAMPKGIRRMVIRQLLERATTWRFVSLSLLESLESALEDDERKRLRHIATVAPSSIAMLDVRDAIRARKREIGARPLYVCVGRLVASKRVDRVIDYVAECKDAPLLVVIGDGPERARLEQVAQRWQIDARFVGNAPRREALTWIGAADELVHASIAEGASTVVREAELLGVKVTLL